LIWFATPRRRSNSRSAASSHVAGPLVWKTSKLMRILIWLMSALRSFFCSHSFSHRRPRNAVVDRGDLLGKRRVGHSRKGAYSFVYIVYIYYSTFVYD